MKPRILIFILSATLGFAACHNSTNNAPLANGIYLVTAVDSSEQQLKELDDNERAVFFSPLFEEYKTQSFRRIVVDASDFVPLELAEEPEAIPQTESKKMLMLRLSEDGSEKLKSFSAKHVMEQVVMVVDGEALTMHKVREPITSGQLQITRCTDNACEKLLIALQK